MSQTSKEHRLFRFPQLRISSVQTLNTFITWLNKQVGQPYVWGGQGDVLTKSNYLSEILKAEKNTGGYSNQTYAEAAADFCSKKFAEGAKELIAYDCSGLGMYFLYNLHHMTSGDMSANSMMSKCDIVSGDPKRGYWVFRLNDSGKASHIGYMVSDTQVVHAKGRMYGVVKEKYSASYWHKCGIPKLFETEIKQPKSDSVDTSKRVVVVVGGTVRVRKKPRSSSKKIVTAHRGDTFPYLKSSLNGWYKIQYNDTVAYISGNPKYTRIE